MFTYVYICLHKSENKSLKSSVETITEHCSEKTREGEQCPCQQCEVRLVEIT